MTVTCTFTHLFIGNVTLCLTFSLRIAYMEGSESRDSSYNYFVTYLLILGTLIIRHKLKLKSTVWNPSA